MNNVLTSASFSQRHITLDTNAGPLSLRIRLSERILHLRTGHGFRVWISLSIVGQFLLEQQTLLILRDVGSLFPRQNGIRNGLFRPAPLLSEEFSTLKYKAGSWAVYSSPALAESLDLGSTQSGRGK